MFKTSHPRRALVAGLLAVIISATIATPAVSTTTVSASTSDCGPLEMLQTFELNDRCTYGLPPLGVVTDSVIVDSLRRVGLFASLVTCLGGGISTVPIVAVPDELLITASDPLRLNEAVANVSRRLRGSVTAMTPLNDLAATLTLRPETLGEAFLRQVVPTLQGRGYSTDLNYLEPALPNNGFHPAGNPVESDDPAPGAGGHARVLVVDSPADEAASQTVTTAGPFVDYDVEDNGFVDEDHGHGVFIASLIQQLAPGAEVVLAGVNGGHLPDSGRWSPMVFSDADVIAAIGEAFGLSANGVERPFNVVNLSLGGAGCGGIGSRLALGRYLRDVAELSALSTGVRPVFVAAAGNDGGDVKHFPAAWRDKQTMQTTAALVDVLSSRGAGNEIRAIHFALAKGMRAVGARTDGVRDSFSNCGTWVNAVARGTAVGRYPSPTGWASWSGTSFATARMSAKLAGGRRLTDISVGNAIGAC